MNKRRIALIVVPLILLAVGLGIWHYRTRSTLNKEEVGRLHDLRDELCNGISRLYPLYPPTSRDPFPAYSPDGRYYVEVHRLWPWERSRRVIEMYEAESGDQVGRYVSSERSLFVYCWAEDSTGVFARDHTLGTGSIFIIFNRPSTDRPVTKLLVSE